MFEKKVPRRIFGDYFLSYFTKLYISTYRGYKRRLRGEDDYEWLVHKDLKGYGYGLLQGVIVASSGEAEWYRDYPHCRFYPVSGFKPSRCLSDARVRCYHYISLLVGIVKPEQDIGEKYVMWNFLLLWQLNEGEHVDSIRWLIIQYFWLEDFVRKEAHL
jgi:hypothetical protein